MTKRTGVDDLALTGAYGRPYPGDNMDVNRVKTTNRNLGPVVAEARSLAERQGR
jgi:hypothetical protein